MKKSVFIAAITFFILTACQDDKKKDEVDYNSEMERHRERVDSVKTAKGYSEMQMGTHANDDMNLAQAARNKEELATFVSALQSSEWINKLETENYIVFAPTNEAFNKLPERSVEDLMKPENSEKLKTVISSHIILEELNSTNLKDLIVQNNNRYAFTTVNNLQLQASVNDAGDIIISDEKGTKSTVVAADFKASNGVIYLIDSVLMKK